MSVRSAAERSISTRPTANHPTTETMTMTDPDYDDDVDLRDLVEVMDGDFDIE